MNGPKVSAFVALVKFGYMLENPRISEYCLERSSDNLWSADNQQERLDALVENPQRPYAEHPCEHG